jgi:hypothetical protein
MERKMIDKYFAYFSIGFALFHFTEETATYFMYGAYFPMLIVDYIAIVTVLTGSWLHLRKNWNMGVICGGWGFEACLLYRAYFSRMSGAMDTNASGADAAIEMQGLLIFMIGVFVAFGFSIWRCAPNKSSKLDAVTGTPS